MRVRRMLVLVVSCLLAVLGLVAPASAAGEVSLTGTITNTDGVPQAGSVCLELVGGGSCGGNNIVGGAWAQTWDPIDEVAGDYLIAVRSSTMDGAVRWYAAANAAGVADKADATAVHLESGAAAFSFTMVMPAIAKVTGTVLDNHDAPAVGVNVSRNQSGHVKSTTTDGSGHYDFGYVRAGAHSLNVSALGENSGASGSMTVPASGDYVAPLLTVQRAATIQGVVTDAASSDPIPLVRVEVFTAGSHDYQGATYTDLNGAYRIPGLGGQPLVARFTDEYGGHVRTLYVAGDPSTWAGEVPFTLAAEEERTIDLAMTPKPLPEAPPHTLSGQVTGPGGTPLPGIIVSNGTLLDETDSNGRWYLDAPSGTHLLRFEDAGLWGVTVYANQPSWFPEYYPDASNSAVATRVTVTPGPSIDNLDMDLTRGAFIRGTVRAADEDSTGFTTGWQAYRADGALDVQQDYVGDAAYTAFVRPGTWKLVLRALRSGPISPGHYLPRWYGDTDTLAAATPITVAPGQIVTGNDVHLTTTFGNVAPPTVSGIRAAGKTLAATPGSWSTMTLTQFATTWWRGSTQVGAGTSYVVKPTDAGASLRARVSATNGTASGTSLSTAAPIAKLVSTATARGTSPRTKRAKLIVTVSAAGLTPTGTIVIRRGTKIIKRAQLTKGKAVANLTRQPKGTQRYTVTYLGTTQIAADATPVLRVRVR